MSQVLIKIDLTGTDWSDSNYYISSESYAGENFYFPFLLKAPNLKIGAPKSGFLKLELGSLIITNEPTNSNHPFYGSRYNTLLSKQLLIPFEVRVSETTNPLFSGNLFLTNVSNDALSFDIYDQAASLQSVDLLKKVLRGDEGVLISSITNASSRCRITTANNHNLADGQVVIFQNMQTIGHELEYDSNSDNYYVIDYNTDTTFDLVDKNGDDVDPTTLEMRDDSTGTVTITVSGDMVGDKITSGLTVAIASGVTITIVDTDTAQTGIPNARPLAFGRVEHITPIFWFDESSNEIINPEMDTSIDNTTAPIADIFLQVFEDGQEIGTSETGDAKVFSTDANASKITLNASASGQLSISGVSSNGTSILDFFENVVAGKLLIAGNAITVNTEKSPKSANLIPGFEIYAGSVTATISSPEDPVTTGDLFINRDTIIDSPFGITSGDTVSIGNGSVLTIEEQIDPSVQPAFINALAFYETQQQSLLGFADKIARFCNHQFTIKDDVLYLIDRSNTPTTATTFQEYDIIEAAITVQGPIRSMGAEWSINEPSGSAIVQGSEPAQGYPRLISRKVTTGVPLLGSGQDIKAEVYHQDEPEVRSYIANVLYIDQRPIASITVQNIQDSLEMGDKVTFSSKNQFITSTFIIRCIEYNFENFTTTLTGDCTSLTQYEAT